MKENTFMIPRTAVEVTLKLKDKQKLTFSTWKFTHHGQKKMSTHQNVCFIHPSLNGIIDTFDQNECESFIIKTL